MRKLKFSINAKLTMLLLVVGVTPLFIVSIVAGNLAEDILIKETFSSLGSIKAIHKKALENYFQERINGNGSLPPPLLQLTTV